MGLSSLAGDSLHGQEQDSAIEYPAHVRSPFINGEVKMSVGINSLTVAALFEAVEIPFAEMNALEMADYVVTVKADNGSYAFSRLGNWYRPFYDALCDAYNKAVLRSLFIKGKPELTAKGEFGFTETSDGSITMAAPFLTQRKEMGAAAVHVYKNNVTALPPDLSARRAPLCFVTGMEKGDYSVTLRIDTDESYTYAKLGYDTKPFIDSVEEQIRRLREESLAAVKEIDPSLASARCSMIAKLAPQGVAAPVGQLYETAPSFVAALERRIGDTRAADSYAVFKELCDPAQIWVGFRRVDDSSKPDDPFLLWIIAPSPDGQFAAVEFAEADSATFIYRTGGSFGTFAKQLNRALEAVGFKREVIRLSDRELRDPENADYFMAAGRTASLRFIRSNFKGRVIHSGAESWKRKLIELWQD